MSYPITFGKYLLLERINVGGMAEVFKAKAFGVEGFERILAIKRILPNMAEDEEFINMFIDEARIAVQLGHPNIVPIYELGKFESQYYIAMEYVPGKDLRQVLDRFRKRETTMPIPVAAYVVAKICEALDYAHRKADPSGRPLNLIHRDVSPQNILLSYEGAVKITDFGIVKAEDRASKTQAGVLKGKFGYMSPEQVRGLEIDRRSDIFAVGILMYEALTGKRLFIGESDFSTLERVRNAEVVPPSQHNPAVGPVLEAVVLKALAKERDDRYQWAMELHDDLQQFLIEDNSVFSANKLGNLLKEEYQEDISNEMAKMEEFMQMPPPSSAEALSAAAQMRAAPTGDWSDNRAEKTMIFESGFAGAGGPTELHESEDLALRPTTSASPEPPPIESSPPPPVARKQTWALIGAAGVFVLLLAALVYILLDGGRGVGTLVVTSSPTDKVDVIMDGEMIGQKTPLIRPNVSVGEHTLLARAPGYGDKAYRFDLVPGAPAEIKIELERTQNLVSGAVGEATVEISSEPPLAAVRLGGVPQASTPYTMTVRDTTHPVVLELVKTGYITQQVTVSFAPNERRKAVHVKMVPVGGGDGVLPPGVSAAKVMVHSRPEGATIYLGGVEKGSTPKEIGDLDPRQPYSLELSKDGFRPFEETLHFSGRSALTINAPLVPDKHAAHRPAAGCSGTGGKISVMAPGISDCRVMVGRASLGVTPFFKKDSPVGRCPIEVKCPGGKKFSTVRPLRVNNEEKIIIKPEDWQ